MIEIKKRDDIYIFFGPESIISTESSGETSNFSPSGSSFLLQMNEEWFLVATDDYSMESLNGYQPQWADKENILAIHDRFTNSIKYGGVSNNPFLLNRPPSSDYGRQQEVTSGKPLQSVIWYRNREGDIQRWVTLFDKEGVLYEWQFNEKVHKGHAEQNYWHEMFMGDWLVFNLSSNDTNRRMPHYRCRYDGTGFEPILFSDDVQLHRSHITVDQDHIAAGWWRGGTTPEITINRISDGEFLAQLKNRQYDHGCLRNDTLLYSVYSPVYKRDIEIRKWNWKTGEDIKVADIQPPTEGFSRFYSRARPSIDNAGTQAIWHEVHDNKIVVCHKRIGPKPKPPVDLSEYINEIEEELAGISKDVGSRILSIEEILEEIKDVSNL